MKTIDFFNFVVISLLTTFFIFTSIFPDINYYLEIIDRVKLGESNFKDYICFLNPIALYPLIFFGDIIGYTFSYFILSIIIGVLITILILNSYEKTFNKEKSISKYILIFFFILPFGMSGYYIDIILYFFATLSIFIYLRKGDFNFYLSSTILSVCFLLKYFSSIPYILAFGLIFFVEWYYNSFKLNYLVKPIKFFLSFLIITNLLIFLYIYVNQINVEIFYEYLFKEMISSGSSRINNFFINIFFLNYNIFSSIKNFEIGSTLFYLFIVSFYFSLFLILTFIFKKKHQNKAIFLIFLTTSTSLTFLIGGRDINHKILYMPVLLIIMMDWISASYFQNKKFFNKLKLKYTIIPLILIYSSIPLNERLNLKEYKLQSFSKNHFEQTFIKIDSGRFKNLFYSLRSRYLKDNGLANYTDQIRNITEFLNLNINNSYKLIFFDPQSKILAKLTNKKNDTPCCGISYESMPPKFKFNRNLFIDKYMNNLNDENSLLIICYFDKIKNKLCINKPKTFAKRNFAVSGDFNRFPELKNYIDKNMKIYYFTNNFVIYINNKNI